MLKFGTSGLRGLVTELTDQECYLYTQAFLNYLLVQKIITNKCPIALAGDLRFSTPKILQACNQAIKDAGFSVDYQGLISTPALSFYSFKQEIPSIMITGSHIPFDRNGIKFNLPQGELLKKDEPGILDQYQKLKQTLDSQELFNPDGSLIKTKDLPEEEIEAFEEYLYRYLRIFPQNIFQGKLFLVYQHSTVVRDLLVRILERMEATVMPVDRSSDFRPLDTEAIELEDLSRATEWAKQYRADAILSSDGDGDRPALFDNNGNFIRGDLLGIICSDYLQADAVATPVSSNTALEKTGRFPNIRRTKIGSPYVIESLNELLKSGYQRVVGYEANGGFLTASPFTLNESLLEALPTRDALLPMLCALAMTVTKKTSLSELLKTYPQRFVYSFSLKDFPTEKSQSIISQLTSHDADVRKLAKEIFDLPADVKFYDFTDGVRMTLTNDDIIHVRPSGNAPELRTYSESDTLEKAKQLTARTLAKLSSMV